MKRVNERGGAAALQGEVDDLRTTVATAGLRFDKGLKASFQQDSWLHLRGGVGYRHASGDRDPAARFAFATGSAASWSAVPRWLTGRWWPNWGCRHG